MKMISLLTIMDPLIEKSRYDDEDDVLEKVNMWLRGISADPYCLNNPRQIDMDDIEILGEASITTTGNNEYSARVKIESDLEKKFPEFDAFFICRGELGGRWYQLKNNKPYILTIKAIKIPSLGELEQYNVVKDIVITKEDLESKVATTSPYSSIPIGL